MSEQVAVIQSTQPEVFEIQRAGRVDRIIEFTCVRFDELQHALIDEPDIETGADRLRKRISPAAPHFLVDECGEQARCQLRIFRLFDNKRGRGANRKLVEFSRGGTVVQAGDGLQRHPHWVDFAQALAATGHCAHDFAHIHRLARARALGHAHRHTRRRRWRQTKFGLLRNGGRTRRSGWSGSDGYCIHGAFPLGVVTRKNSGATKECSGRLYQGPPFIRRPLLPRAEED